MAADTKIEWCDHTFNPWIGCTKVSTAATCGGGCDNCYAEVSTPARVLRAKGVETWGPHAARHRTSPANWALPKRWNDQHEAFFTQHGRRQRVFCASLADVFDNAAPASWRIDLFNLIAGTPNLDWLLLTKRIGNAHAMLDEVAGRSFGLPERTDWKPLPNVWLGATIVNQHEADRDIPKLLSTPAARHFLSMEPLLGPVDLRHLTCGESEVDALKPDTWEDAIERWRDTDEDWIEQFEDWFDVNLSNGPTGPMHAGIDWVIVGGESGPGARPMHPDWASNLREQCQAAGVPLIFKQWGEWKPISQMEEAEHNALYRSRVKAQPHEDQANLDDICGRFCTVDTAVVHNDGSVHRITEPMSFLQGTGAMQAFKIGKTAAGRLLDGLTWDQFPEEARDA